MGGVGWGVPIALQIQHGQAKVTGPERENAGESRRSTGAVTNCLGGAILEQRGVAAEPAELRTCIQLLQSSYPMYGFLWPQQAPHRWR
jgi:hypothetical protein